MTPPQRFVISQLDEAAFKTGGLHDYSAYRDLCVAEVTRGLAHAHVIRMIVPFRLEPGSPSWLMSHRSTETEAAESSTLWL